MISNRSCEALLTNITPLSSHDGPGLRTTLFFKGCPLRCRWCHNPETIRSVPELEWDRRFCIECRVCNTYCRNGAICFGEERDYLIDKKQCLRCFVCADHCPSQALKVIGKRYSLEELEALILKDEKLIKNMGGGITFSGGEPTLQSAFILQLSQNLKNKNFHLALDTCGQASWESYEQLLPYMDLLLIDLKEMDPTKHIEFTGSDNRLIHENILHIVEYIHFHRLSTRIWIRTPLIPGMTASLENMSAIGTFIDTYLSGDVDKWELCAFNNLCNDKYDRLGIQWNLKRTELLSERIMEELLLKAKQSVSSVKHVMASGLNKK